MNKTVLMSLTALPGTLLFGSVATMITGRTPEAAVKPAAHAAVAAPVLLPSTGEAAITDAAMSFLATLTDKQRTTAEVDLSADNAARWSNFPTTFVPRNGVFMRDLNDKQTASAPEACTPGAWRRGLQTISGYPRRR